VKWYKKLVGKTVITNRNPDDILMSDFLPDGRSQIIIQRCLPERFLKNLPDRILRKHNSEVKRKYHITTERPLDKENGQGNTE